MDITVNASPQPVREGDFRYSNVESEYGANTLYFTRGGRPYVVIAGELHFSRVPARRWRETLLKMRECGLNTVSTYVFWNHHEPYRGAFDFSGDRDITAFLTVCRDIGMACVLRIGPWCHGEALWGGFPGFVERMKGKRSDDGEYLKAVRDYWVQLYERTARFMDGETVIAIQLENEYGGPIDHLRTLRRIAEEIGFRAPFFTMTAWPDGHAYPDFLPMTGGYPDAPWENRKAPMEPNNRFAVASARTDAEMGIDALDDPPHTYDGVPFASCETGPGNQVTQLRRPYIGEKDGWGVGFAKFAAGANWLGYYMFCGGANPPGSLLQESRASGYGNDYPIIDYDFQAPISRWGVCRPHGDRLRLMHLFINEFDPDICRKPTYCPKWPTADPHDVSFLRYCVRMDENGSGYFFAGSYEKGLEYPEFRDVRVTVRFGGKKIVLPAIDVVPGAMFFYPFGLDIDGVRFDYVLAQPVAKTRRGDETVCYFVRCEGIEPVCSADGREIPLDLSDEGVLVGGVRLIVMDHEKARGFHFIDGRAFFSDGTVWRDGTDVFCEKEEEADLPGFALSRCEKKDLPYDEYLLSEGERAYYELSVPVGEVERHPDVRVAFAFGGLNLQVFCGDTLINDCFNIDGTFEMRLRDFLPFLRTDPKLTIRTVPRTRTGVSDVYIEKPVPYGKNSLALTSARAVGVTKLFEI